STNMVANGTMAATECIAYDSSNQITSFRLTGRLQYAVPASGTNAPVIYNGILVAGSEIEENEHGEGDHHGEADDHAKPHGDRQHRPGHDGGGDGGGDD
ncbi:MAG: hypothetical protein KGS61_17960, partial [Verrucomicrobia bacterium]|nr:hypothetical protein [Verrucomicrobiota bacterium]